MSGQGSPVIGIAAHPAAISWGPWHEVEATFVPETYLGALEAAGGAPLIVPPRAIYDQRPELVLDLVDGLLLIGGDDIDPKRYAAERDPRTGRSSEIRDGAELALLREAIERKVPTLAICRGCQLLNVVLGGTLTQEVVDITDDQSHRPRPGTFGEHRVKVTDGVLAETLGSSLLVKSHHHQSIDRLGNGLSVTATSEDQLVEGIELGGDAFCVGVLWHPEELLDLGAQILFRRLVLAAAGLP